MTTRRSIAISGTVVLLSGGLDSVAALHWVLENRERSLVRAIGFRYGQPNADSEIVAAGRIATDLGVSYRVLALADALATDRPDGLLREVPDHDLSAQGIHRAFVTGRNCNFLGLAATHACAWFRVGNVELVMGCNRDDALFPDCQSGNLDRYVASLRPNYAREIRLVLPFADWSKDRIVGFASPKARADIARSWSCYQADGPCGRCTPCVLRAAAFAVHGVIDQAAPAKMFGGDPAREAQ